MKNGVKGKLDFQLLMPPCVTLKKQVGCTIAYAWSLLLFLTKDLLIDYRKGEKYFAQNLLDFDLAANNGGWQWCASTGCDAQPYFRVFNPETQSKNFDPNGSFIKKYCPELSRFSDKYVHAPSKAPIADQQKANCIIGKNYPLPVVHHDKQRLKAIEMFNAKKKAN